ncbi:MAG: hypothetical protein BGO77_00445 [Caedibacter sp. 37-49]|nr:MAG: hypothetical protein BGO77_00445 [Caedibacter sp. 37-49]
MNLFVLLSLLITINSFSLHASNTVPVKNGTKRTAEDAGLENFTQVIKKVRLTPFNQSDLQAYISKAFQGNKEAQQKILNYFNERISNIGTFLLAEWEKNLLQELNVGVLETVYQDENPTLSSLWAYKISLLNTWSTPEKVRNQILVKAKNGDADAQLNLAIIYEKGLGVVNDMVEATKWYKLAAEQKYAPALYLIGNRCYDAEEILNNYSDPLITLAVDQGENYLRLAADQGYAPALYELGQRYEDGWGVKNSKEEALKCYQKAATLEHIKAKERVKKLSIQKDLIAKVQQDSTSLNSELVIDFRDFMRPDSNIYHLRHYNFNTVKNLLFPTLSSPSEPKEIIVIDLEESLSDHEDNSANNKTSQKQGISLKETLSPAKNKASLSILKMQELESKINQGETGNKGKEEYELATLYEKENSFNKTSKDQYLLKAVSLYQQATSKGCNEAQMALERLSKKAIGLGQIDEDLMRWYKKALTDGKHDYDLFIKGIYTLKLSDIIFIDIKAGKHAPIPVFWGGRSNSNTICKPLYFKNAKLHKYDDTIMTIDPSGDGDDETAYCVAKRCQDYYYITALGGLAGGYHKKDTKERMGNSPTVINKLIEIANLHKVHFILIEKNNDNSYANLLKHKLKESPSSEHIEVKKYHQNKKKEKRIIDILKPLLNTRRLIIDRNVIQEDFKSIPTNDLHYKFFYQLMHISLDEAQNKNNTLKHDDRLDAAAMAIEYLTVKAARTKNPQYASEYQIIN